MGNHLRREAGQGGRLAALADHFVGANRRWAVEFSLLVPPKKNLGVPLRVP